MSRDSAVKLMQATVHLLCCSIRCELLCIGQQLSLQITVCNGWGLQHLPISQIAHQCPIALFTPCLHIQLTSSHNLMCIIPGTFPCSYIKLTVPD